MTSEEYEALDILCGRIQKESDPQKFTKLLVELDHLLRAQRRHIAAIRVVADGTKQ